MSLLIELRPSADTRRIHRGEVVTWDNREYYVAAVEHTIDAAGERLSVELVPMSEAAKIFGDSAT